MAGGKGSAGLAAEPKEEDDDESDEGASQAPQTVKRRQTVTERQIADLESQVSRKASLLKTKDIRDNVEVRKELDVSFISADTIKNLFNFMQIEAGDEGEKSIDLVLKG